MSTPNIRSVPAANQRRSQRVLLSVRLTVAGKRKNGTPFKENTSTLVVSAHGGLLLLKEEVSVGDILTLRNQRTTEEVSCTVINITPGGAGAAELGVEFAAPNPKFWRVSFPPEDWTTQSPEAKPIVFKPAPPKPVKPKPSGQT